MPTKATLKLVKQLQQKKYRKEYNLFVVEGVKSVQEFLASDFKLTYLFVTNAVSQNFPMAEVCSVHEMQYMSGLKTAPPILAVFEQINYRLPDTIESLTLALDNVQDPGNLGTLIRLADWFGIKDIYCNKSTVDVYNPKVIQACMGSLTRVRLHFLELNTFLSQQKTSIFGTFMDGENLYTNNLPSHGIIVLGNEAHGISDEIASTCTHRISIPQAGSSTESLNVALAGGIIISEFFRRKNY